MARLENVPPLAISRGEAGWLYDTDGRRYFDTISSWWVNILGHANQEIIEAVTEQASRLPHVKLGGCTHEPAVTLAERLAALTHHNLGHVFFASDGSSAVEVALKQCFHARAMQGKSAKNKFVCLENSYHGETIGALSVTDVPLFQNAYRSLLSECIVVKAPDSRLDNEDFALTQISELLTERADDIAALIVEPRVQCGGGMSMHSIEYLKKLRQMTREHDVYLIADEIAVGCGRTGTFLAWEQVNAVDWPDILLLSKGITGGNLPLSIVLSSDQIYETFLDDDFRKGFLHSHSYTGNPLACAAANVVLDKFDNGLTSEIFDQANLISRAFKDLSNRTGVSNFRQCGTIIAFEVDQVDENFAEEFHMNGRHNEILIRPIGNTVYLMPPYVIDGGTASFLANAVEETIEETLR